jgi:hypothetical protein
VLVARAYHDGKNASHRGTFVFALSTKDRSSVRMRAWALADAAEVESLPATPDCELTWNREAAQFRGSAAGDCGDTMPVEMIVSERQFWLSFAAEGENYAMHRVRNFRRWRRARRALRSIRGFSTTRYGRRGLVYVEGGPRTRY